MSATSGSQERPRHEGRGEGSHGDTEKRENSGHVLEFLPLLRASVAVSLRGSVAAFLFYALAAASPIRVTPFDIQIEDRVFHLCV